jgi:hypothetical protein
VGEAKQAQRSSGDQDVESGPWWMKQGLGENHIAAQRRTLVSK